ncbi:TrkH family potassium uptake protein [Metabacillus litoralis]|uniref:TrkH family potassium uptake protein n=1 Tax=Metabacillus litoralis TaxID=152268 RepID=UPI001CFF23F4|nr:TrkH family potassium uptake protein [Metabacillus litoralis]
MKYKDPKLNPSQLLVWVFVVFISLGTIALKLPFATTTPVSWLDAMFTATSAMTVTGLVVVDTAKAYTLFGEIIIITLIQFGGLGIMSFAVMIYKIIGKKIGLKERIVVQHALNQTSFGGVIKLIKKIFIFSITIELIATFFLAITWVPEYGLGKGMYVSFFHSVSAFNNAGFSLWSDSLMKFKGDPIINIVITFLFIIGGIGFTVLADLWEKKKFKKLSLHSKMMIIGTIAFNIFAMFLIFVLEYGNPKTLGGLTSLGDKLWGAYFQAVTPRTAGFNTLDIASFNESTIFLFLLMMFIGAGSASTGGGIKLTTFMVIVFSVLAFLKGKEDIVVRNRSIKLEFVLRSLAISTIGFIVIILAVFILNITENSSFLSVLFEVVSAFGTVGLSIGLTESLSMIGKFVIIFMMFIGKLGPLTLAFSLTQPKKSKVKYPSEDILTG